MLHERINLEEIFPGLPKTEKTAMIEVFIPGVFEEISLDKRFPCVVLCPGGAYFFRCQREDEPTVLRLLGAGIAVIKVEYSCGTEGGHYPDQLLQVSAAVALARRNSEKWHIDTNRIVVMGFSAGGHLAATVGTRWQKPFIRERLGLAQDENKVNGMVLCYPVITSGEFTHEDSMRNLLGEAYQDEALREEVSLEKQVTEYAPKTFLWHTFEDDLVPVENTLMMAEALRKQGIQFEMHVYPKGPHGLASGEVTTANRPEELHPDAEYVSSWIQHCIRWIREVV